VDFEQVFAQQVTPLSRAGDVTIASTSGNSTNVLEGMKAAKAARLTTIFLSGDTSG
jgi:D-sedoheptulose 7-phosphate isomerase